MNGFLQKKLAWAGSNQLVRLRLRGEGKAALSEAGVAVRAALKVAWGATAVPGQKETKDFEKFSFY